MFMILSQVYKLLLLTKNVSLAYILNEVKTKHIQSILLFHQCDVKGAKKYYPIKHILIQNYNFDFL